MKNPETTAIAPTKPAPVRGKYANLLQQGTNIAILDPDIVEHFPDSASVNNALRAFLAIGKEIQSASTLRTRKSTRGTTKRTVKFDPRTGRSATNAAATGTK